MGYYPTPPVVVEAIKSLLAFPEQTFYALDPCCGEGKALEQLLSNTAGTGCGVELDAARAKEARSRLTRVLNDAWEFCTVQHDCFSLCLNNPPYDHDIKEDLFKKAKRKEYLWIKDMHAHLLPGAVMVYIIQQERYDQLICRALATHYEQIRVWRFPDGEYERFKQTVLIGVRKEKPARNYKLEQELLQIPRLKLEPLKIAQNPLYSVPPASNKLYIFRPGTLRPEDIDHETKYSPLYDRVKKIFEFSQTKTRSGRPPLPLNPAHKAIFLVAGCMNGTVGEGQDLHLLKGTERLEIETTTETVNGQVIVTTRETRVPQLVVVEPSGRIIDLIE